MQDLGVVERLENGLLDGFGEEWILVGRFVAPYQGLQLLLLGEVPVKEAEVAVRDGDSTRNVDGLCNE